MKDLWYQCHLRQGQRETVGYIKESAAKRGNFVELLSPGFDIGFWEVIRVSLPGVPYSRIQKAEENRRDKRNFQSTKAK